MSVERDVFVKSFFKGRVPQYTCPTCCKGILMGIKGSFIYSEEKVSKECHKMVDWDPDQVRYVYSCIFKCSNPLCEERVYSAGTGTVDFDVDFDSDGTPSQRYFDCFVPKLFLPHLNIFSIAKATPLQIRAAINESFKVFFLDPSASLNNLRIAVELIMDHLGVSRFIIKKGKRVYLNLHSRIDSLSQKYATFKDLFLAVKWLGNFGSHSKAITMDDVMDAYDIIENILDEIFDKKTNNIKSLAKRINKNKGIINKA